MIEQWFIVLVVFVHPSLTLLSENAVLCCDETSCTPAVPFIVDRYTKCLLLRLYTHKYHTGHQSLNLWFNSMVSSIKVFVMYMLLRDIAVALLINLTSRFGFANGQLL